MANSIEAQCYKETVAGSNWCQYNWDTSIDLDALTRPRIGNINEVRWAVLGVTKRQFREIGQVRYHRGGRG